MNTVLVDKENMEQVVERILRHEVVAFPTETVFGLGVKYDSLEAIEAIYKIKGREASKAITLMVHSIEQISEFAYVDRQAQKVIDAFMPGKLTVVLLKTDRINDVFTANLQTIGIRIPDNPFVLSMLKRTGPMWVTSANLSGESSATKDTEVLEKFNGRVALIVRGNTNSKTASTVVDLSKGKVRILREGDISKKELEEVYDENCDRL